MISRRNSADYTHDLANTADLAESLLNSLKQAARGIGFYVNANKIEYTCLNKKKPSPL